MDVLLKIVVGLKNYVVSCMLRHSFNTIYESRCHQKEKKRKALGAANTF